MEIVEVRSPRPRDARRLARALMLLVAGGAAHVWLSPPPARPMWVRALASAAEQLSAATADRVVATSGNSAGMLAVASTVGSASPAPTDGVREHRAADSVSVVIETVRAAIVGPARESQAPVQFAAAGLGASAPAASESAAPVDEPSLEPVASETSEPTASPEATIATPPPAQTDEIGALRHPIVSIEAVLPRSRPAPAPVAHAFDREAESAPREEPSDERLVSSVLQQYRAAYESLDVTAAQSIWPTVDARALGAAFRQLAGQRVTFDSCGVDISGGGQATARCRGQAEYVPKVGARRAHVASGEWTFALAKQDAAWRIVNASAIIK